MPHLYQQPSSQDQHPAGYHHGGAVPPPQTAGAPQQTAQHLMTMLPPPHVSATQQAAAQHPQITPPHPYSTNPYGVATPGAGAGAGTGAGTGTGTGTGTAGGSAAIPPMATHPHHAAAYQAGFASAQAHAAQHVANLQAAQQAQAQQHAQHAQHAQIHAAMFGIPAAAAAAGQQHHHPHHHAHHHAHLPYRPSAIPPSSLAGQDASVTISPGIKREDSGSITGTSMDNGDGRASAEDIAVSALSMLCGAALGEVKVKKEEDADEAEMQSLSKESGAVRVEGSPSFVEESKKTTTDGAAPATAASTAAATAHISPASTVGSTGAEGTPAESVKQVVVDHAAAAGVDASASAATGKPVPHFPSLLHDVLTNSRHAGSVLEWLPHGQGWRVLRWDEMARTVLPEHFPQFCPSSEAATKEDTTSAGEKTKKEKEEGEGDGDNTNTKAKAKQLRRKPPMLPLRHKAEETSSKGAGGGDVNTFLSHVRAWGFQEVRDGGPDMGSYRHALFLRGNPNLSRQMRLMNGQRPYAPSAVSMDTADAPIASLQVPSLLSSASSGSMADKRKIGQTVSRDSHGSPSTKRGRFTSMPAQQQPQMLLHNGMGHIYVGGAGAMQMAPHQPSSLMFAYNPTNGAAAGAQGISMRKISDAHLPKHPGAPTPGTIFRGATTSVVTGGRVSMRGRSRGVAAPAPAMPMASLQMAQHPALDRRDEIEHRAPAPAVRANFPVSTRGRAGRKGLVRALIHNTASHGSEAADAMMMMMKGVSSVSAGSSSAPSVDERK